MKMIGKYDNLGNYFKTNKINILNLIKNKKCSINEASLSKLSTQKRNKSKNKSKEKNKHNLFKTINLLQNNKKDYKNIKQSILIKNNKNEINIKLNLNYALLNNINNINNIQKYNNILNNQICTYNYLNNSNSFEDLIRENHKNSKRELYNKNNNLNMKKKKNLSQINLTNLINNKCKIHSISASKNKSTENIYLTNNKYNKRYNSEKNFNNLLKNINLLYEKSYNYNNKIKRSRNKSNKPKSYSKNLNLFNLNQQKNVNSYHNNIKSNYNVYNTNIKNYKNKNRYNKSYKYKNLCKNYDNILSSYITKNNYKTPKTNRKNNNFSTNNKSKDFNFLLFDDIYYKTKNTLEKCKKALEMQLMNKS